MNQTRQARLNKMLKLARSNPDLANLGSLFVDWRRNDISYMDPDGDRIYSFIVSWEIDPIGRDARVEKVRVTRRAADRNYRNVTSRTYRQEVGK